MSTTPPAKTCIACGSPATAAPLLSLEYRQSTFWICPQHLPILIHQPDLLVGKLPGAEVLKPADHHDESAHP
jgi:hypothetical protein